MFNVKDGVSGAEMAILMHLESEAVVGYDGRSNWRRPIRGLAKTQLTRRRYGTFK